MTIVADLDRIRLEIADTDASAPLLQDDEIYYVLASEPNFWSAAARCCEIISRQFLRKADVRLGRALSLTYSTMAKQYEGMAQALRNKANAASGGPWAGGTSITEKETYREQADTVQPIFARDMQENPRAGGYTPDIGATEGGDTGGGS